VNPVEKVVRRLDTAQQRHQPAAFVVGVVKKFSDDNGPVLVANLAYAAFISVFPLLLILVTVLVMIAANDPSLRNQIISGATAQFPLIGKQLANNIHVLRRSTAASLVVGLLVLTWGVTRLAQAGLFAMEQVWNLPGPARPGYFPRLGRSVEFLAVLALGVVTSTLLASLVTYGRHALAFRMLAQLLAAATSIGLYLLGFRVLTPKGVPLRRLVPGSIAGGIFWTALQAAGAYLVHHELRSNSVYGIFATVLGLVAWIYISAEATVYAATMALQALQNQRREEQQIEVTFNDRPAGAEVPGQTPRTPQDVSPPATMASRDTGTPDAKADDKQAHDKQAADKQARSQ
jgi:YihY family inner membrane protein